MGHVLNWQTAAALAMGVVALGYLVRRWWPRGTGEVSSRVAGPGAMASGGADVVSAPRTGGCSACGGCGTNVADRCGKAFDMQRSVDATLATAPGCVPRGSWQVSRPQRDPEMVIHQTR